MGIVQDNKYMSSPYRIQHTWPGGQMPFEHSMSPNEQDSVKKVAKEIIREAGDSENENIDTEE